MLSFAVLFSVLLAYPALSSAELSQRQADISGLPACGQHCLISAVTNNDIRGSCSLTDTACLCKDQRLQDSVTSCVISTCSSPEQLQMLNFASTNCPEVSIAAPKPQPESQPTPQPEGKPKAEPKQVKPKNAEELASNSTAHRHHQHTHVNATAKPAATLDTHTNGTWAQVANTSSYNMSQTTYTNTSLVPVDSANTTSINTALVTPDAITATTSAAYDPDVSAASSFAGPGSWLIAAMLIPSVLLF